MYQKFVKRSIDLAVAVVVLVVAMPVIIITAVVIKIESKGPVFYKQKRTGLGGNNFTLYKFRSTPPENDVRDLTKANQFTKSGIVIRRLSIDELPQLINVFKGEMSLIGPRPWIPEYYRHMNNEQRHRVDVLPGITGLAQACGRNTLTINAKINYDLEYVRDFSLKEDIKIIFLTVKSIFEKEEHTIDKHGIENELEVLRNQDSNMISESGTS